MVTIMVTKRIAAGEFKAHCLELMDRVARDHEPIIITKRGKPVAQLAPLGNRPKTLFGFAKGQLTILGDIVAPLDLDWEADRD